MRKIRRDRVFLDRTERFFKQQLEPRFYVCKDRTLAQALINSKKYMYFVEKVDGKTQWHFEMDKAIWDDVKAIKAELKAKLKKKVADKK